MIVLSLFVLLGTLTSPQPSPAVDATQLYRLAMEQLASLDQPTYIDTTEKRVTTAASPQGTATGEQVLRAVFDSAARRECVFLEPGDQEVVIGPSYFAPDMWILGKRPRPSPAPYEPDVAPDLTDIKVIADVVSIATPAYHIRYAAGGMTAHNGDRVDHIILDPLSDPKKHNLRELWIDTSTYRIDRAIIRGSYRPTPHDLIEETYALEDFGQVGAYWLVVHRIWTYAPPFSNVKVTFEATVQTMRFPDTLPAWLFDQAEFRKHSAELQSVLGPPASPSPR